MQIGEGEGDRTGPRTVKHNRRLGLTCTGGRISSIISGWLIAAFPTHPQTTPLSGPHTLAIAHNPPTHRDRAPTSVDPRPHDTGRLGRRSLPGSGSPAGMHDGWTRSLGGASAQLACRAGAATSLLTRTRPEGHSCMQTWSSRRMARPGCFWRCLSGWTPLRSANVRPHEVSSATCRAFKWRCACSMGTAYLVDLGGGRPAAMAHPEALADGLARPHGRLVMQRRPRGRWAAATSAAAQEGEACV